MAPTALEKLVARREVVLQNLMRIETKAHNHSKVPLSEIVVQRHQERINNDTKELQSIQNEIVAIAPDDEIDAYKQKYDDICDLADSLTNVLHGIRIGLAQSAASSSTSLSSASAVTKLPKLDLKQFDGNLLEWISFRDIFESAVHQNSAVPKVQKLVYLKSLVKGEASRLIQSLVLSESNYDTAWSLLHDRYQNEREILFSVLRRFFSQQFSPTATGIRQVIDVKKESVRSMEILQLVSNQVTEAIILYYIVTKLDSQTRELWEQSQRGKSIPPLADLFEFMKQRARALAASNPHRPRSSRTDDQSNRIHVHHGETNSNCKCCGHSVHPLYKCSKFTTSNVQTRYDILRKFNACFNCLAENHNTKNCKSSGRCKQCNQKHNTLLHTEAQKQTHVEVVSASHGTTHSAIGPKKPTSGLLTTAIIEVMGSNGSFQLCRAFLDAGSTSSFVTQSCATRLGLQKSKIKAEVVGLGSTFSGTAKEIATINLKPYFTTDDKFYVNAFILPKVTADLPGSKVDPSVYTHLNHLKLADPNWFKPGAVDILLGADIFWSLIKANRISGPTGSPVAVDSKLGWLVAGNIHNEIRKPVQVNFANEARLDEQLKEFWEVEQVPQIKHLTSTEFFCENFFEKTTTRNDNGTFVVRLPFNQSKSKIGSSAQMAIRRLTSLERRLAANQNHHKKYIDFMREYEELGHMVKVKRTYRDHSASTPVYIPHHFVEKSDSTTTKFRVVFDASAKTTTGTSLNDALIVGPTLQDNLIDIINRFRIHPVAFIADVAKMYRQIKIHKDDRKYQHILWREDPNGEIEEYELNTVTYGTASAPYLAVKCLQQLAKESASSQPVASKIALESFYVDDLMDSCPDSEAAIHSFDDLRLLTHKGGFKLRKWATNNQNLFNHIPDEFREKNFDLEISSQSSIKTLGIWWDTKSDCFYFQPKSEVMNSRPKSKRDVLSQISKLYDPIGWLSPAVIKSKILMQDLWKANLTWDESLPSTFINQWLEIASDLSHLTMLRIPRCLVPAVPICLDLVGFSDASEKAYAAVVYLCVSFADNKKVSLITSKTRVAPVKSLSLPRLELCGATLLANLMMSVSQSLKLQINSYHAYTDSTVVLAWIQASPSRWKTFIANRVAEIQQTEKTIRWHHVPGIVNPADCASRGLSIQELINFPLWWNGPVWLSTRLTLEEETQIQLPSDVDMEEKPSPKIKCHHSDVKMDSFITNFSSRLLRITSWCRRFIRNCTKKADFREFGPLCTDEIQQSLLVWVRSCQQQYFPQELQYLTSNQPLRSSRIQQLSPFLDNDQVIRVGGRLRHSKIPYKQKFPIILPRRAQLTDLIIQSKHRQHLHAGLNLLMSIIQQQFWILGAKDAIKFHVKRCVVCAKANARVQNQLMGNLPSSRVVPSPAFNRCGVDFAGPMTLKSGKIRSPVTQKAYISLFVCFTTRAFHLELVSSLSTASFVAALKRFVARRGLPSEIHSDCGTNFVGANKQLKDLQKLVKSTGHNEAVSKFLAQENISWVFNPPGAPHFGGLWEAGVKSVKTHLNRIIGNHRLTFEEMTTVISQIEACLNSRPLTEILSDPSELEVLTPGHFLVGRPLLAVPEHDLLDAKQSQLSRWQLVQQVH